jgi:hypothetical protein
MASIEENEESNRKMEMLQSEDSASSSKGIPQQSSGGVYFAYSDCEDWLHQSRRSPHQAPRDFALHYDAVQADSVASIDGAFQHGEICTL